jgi:undecaprenyl diphosphate synthase
MRHLAIIMDGNRRWARRHHQPILAGHDQGSEALRRTALYANDLGLPFLTVYAFSTENWQRPLDEVNGLMGLFSRALTRLLPELHDNGIRLRFFGGLSQFPAEIREQQEYGMRLTQHNSRMVLQVAMNYGSRRELLRACVALIEECREKGRASDELTEEDIGRHLYLPNCPDPDVVLRSGGEHRLSNFMLWQAAYAEVMISDVLWPDFSPADLDKTILEFSNRRRRFGR